MPIPMLPEAVINKKCETQMDAALAYAKAGWKIFPCRANGYTDKKGAVYAPKSPLTAHWKEDATTDEAQIRAWWSEHPNAAIAMPMGQNCTVAIDCDIDEATGEMAGEEELFKLLSGEKDFVLATAWQTTPSGGCQILFAVSDEAKLKRIKNAVGKGQGQQGKPAWAEMPHCDVRSTGGYIVVAPSTLGSYKKAPHGGQYAWHPGVPWVQEMPESLYGILPKKDEPKAPAPARLPMAQAKPQRQQAKPASTYGRPSPYTLSVLEAEAGELAQTAKGGRNAKLNAAAIRTMRLFKGDGITDFAEVRRALYGACQANGYIQDDGEPAFDKTFASAMRMAEREGPAYPPQNGGGSRQAPRSAGRPAPRRDEVPLPDEVPPPNEGGRRESVCEEPTPFRRPMPKQAEYPVDAFGPLAGAVKAMATHCHVHESVAGGVSLACLSLLAQRIFNVTSKAYGITPLSLYVLTVLESGGGKDTVERVALRIVREWEKEQRPAYEKALEEYRIEEKVYQKALKALDHRVNGKDFDMEQYRQELAELERTAPKQPVLPRMTSGNLNLEGLYRRLRDEAPSHAAFAAEGGILFGGYAFNKDNKGQTISAFNEIWSSGRLDKMRQVEGFSDVTDRRFCMSLMVQPCIAEELFSDRAMQEQGLLCRSLFAWPAFMSRDVVDVDVETLPEMKPYYDACRTLLNLKPPQNDEPGKGLELAPLKLEGEAFSIYQTFYRKLEEEIAGGEKGYEGIASYARRAAENSMRIAGILTAAWYPHSQTVLPEAMEAAIKLAQWHLDEILRIMLADAVSPQVKNAEALMKFFAAKGIDRTSKPQIQVYGPGKVRDKKDIDEAVALLQEHGWLVGAGQGVVWYGDKNPPKKAKQTWLVMPGYDFGS